ncbi:hypothetical protein E2P81_ATG11628 [Venturia nashicola]|nr:hypothetical protein E2P81_ATG11628 [Venturia nashicola]
MRRQRIHRTETGNHETRSRNSLVTISSFESLCTHVVQQKNDSTELEEEYAQFLPSPPVTPPGREEYFRDMKAQQKEVQRRVLPPITAVSTPSSFIQPQGPHPNKQLKYIPNFSRPFSRSNPPAVQNAIWRTRMRGQEIQDDAEPEPLDRYLRGKLDEHLLTKKIEGLRKEVEMIDERGDEWKKALGILEETELKMALEMSMEMKEDGDDYGSLDCAKVG